MMRRIPWRPLIVAVGVAVLMLGALLGTGTWATVFLTEPGELACETVSTPAGKVTNCSTVEETTLWQRLTTKYTYRSEERRVGKEGRSRRTEDNENKKVSEQCSQRETES